jgi:hypothetical protein
MRPLLRVAVPLALAAAMLLVLWQGFRTRSEILTFRGDRALLKREFVERAQVARGLGSDRAREAADESRALLRWYFEELQALRNRHRQPKAGPTLAALLEQRPKATAEERRTLEEFFRYAGDRYEALRAGRLDPLITNGAAGLRLDVLSIEPAQHPATQERGVRIDFALWGVPRRTDRETQAGHTTERAGMAATFQQLALRFLDGDGKPYGEMSGSGEPYLKLADPEKFAEDFPPGILFGSWYLEAFPREAARVVVTLQLQLAGVTPASVASTLSFEAPVAETWKLPPGAAFRGETREDASLAPAPRGKR